MDTSRLGPSAMIAGVSGLALFVFLFFDWLGPLNAWETFDVMDIVLAVIGLGALAIAGLAATGSPLANAGAILAADGLIATSVTLTFLLEGDERKIGLWLAVAASLGLLYAGVTALREGVSAPPRARPGGSAPGPNPPG